jgi:hypothetical protein
MSRFCLRFLAAATAILSAACPTHADVSAGETLTIKPSEAACILTWTGPRGSAELSVGISSPCAFNRDQDGMIRLVGTARGRVALVESSLPDPDRAGSCITHVRGVLVAADGAVSLSPHISMVAACLPFRWDEKMFIGLFEQ